MNFDIHRFWFLVLKCSPDFPITRFFPGPKNCVKGGVPVHKWCIKESYFLWYFLHPFFCMDNKNIAKQEFSFAIRKLGFPYQHVHRFNVSFPQSSTLYLFGHLHFTKNQALCSWTQHLAPKWFFFLCRVLKFHSL